MTDIQTVGGVYAVIDPARNSSHTCTNTLKSKKMHMDSRPDKKKAGEGEYVTPLLGSNVSGYFILRPMLVYHSQTLSPVRKKKLKLILLLISK